jgi:hypothetical protein
MEEIFYNRISCKDGFVTIKDRELVNLMSEKCNELQRINKNRTEVTVKEADIKSILNTLTDEPITNEIQNSILNIFSGNFKLEDAIIIGQNPKVKDFITTLYQIPASLFEELVEAHLSDLTGSEYNYRCKLYYAILKDESGKLKYISDEQNPKIIASSECGLLLSATAKIEHLSIITNPIDVCYIGCLIKNPSKRKTKLKDLLNFEVFLPYAETWIPGSINMEDVSDFNVWIQLFKLKANYKLQEPDQDMVPYFQAMIGKILDEAEKSSSKSADPVKSKVNAAIETFAQENHHLLKLTYNKDDAEYDPSGNTIYIEGENAYLTNKGVINPIEELIKPIKRNQLKTMWDAKTGPKNRYNKIRAQNSYWIVKIKYIESLITYLRFIGIESGNPQTTDEADVE